MFITILADADAKIVKSLDTLVLGYYIQNIKSSCMVIQVKKVPVDVGSYRVSGNFSYRRDYTQPVKDGTICLQKPGVVPFLHRGGT